MRRDEREARVADPLNIRTPRVGNSSTAAVPNPLEYFHRTPRDDLNFVAPPQKRSPPHSGRRAKPSAPPLGMKASNDVSFLADDAVFKRHGGVRPPPPPVYAGTEQEWQTFKKEVSGRRAIPVRATPAKVPPPVPGLRTPRSPGVRLGLETAASGALSGRAQHDQSTGLTSKALSQNAVAALLFPSEAGKVEAAIAGAAGVEGRSPSPPPPPQPAPGQPFGKPLNFVEVQQQSGQGQSEPSGRAQALRLASTLAQSVGAQSTPGLPPALTPGASAALSAPTDPASASIVATHNAILALAPSEVAPHQAQLDHVYGELIRRVVSDCTEQAVLIEYLRRHHMAAAQTARLLLQRLQLTVGMYEELRQAMDGSLLQRFQDSLGDAFAALKVEEAAGAGFGGSPRRGSGAAGKGRRAGGHSQEYSPSGALSPELRPDIA